MSGWPLPPVASRSDSLSICQHDSSAVTPKPRSTLARVPTTQSGKWKPTCTRVSQCCTCEATTTAVEQSAYAAPPCTCPSADPAAMPAVVAAPGADDSRSERSSYERSELAAVRVTSASDATNHGRISAMERARRRFRFPLQRASHIPTIKPRRRRDDNHRRLSSIVTPVLLNAINGRNSAPRRRRVCAAPSGSDVPEYNSCADQSTI